MLKRFSTGACIAELLVAGVWKKHCGTAVDEFSVAGALS